MLMKKFYLLIAAIITFSFLFASCQKENVPATISDDVQIEQQEVVDPVQKEIDLFFEKYVESDERPIAIMVDNDNKDARPHAGLDEAYLIYEMIIEGGSTRFMAVYKNADTEKIGPIRSSRHYFLDYVMENDAIYTHFGWSPKAMQDISQFKINKINGVLGSDEDIFWREKKYKGDWHSAYTSIENILEMAQTKKYKSVTEHKNSIEYSDTYIDINPENIASEINMKYSYKYTTGYSYNAEKGTYEKSIDNEPHIMQNGNVLEVKNIIVQFIADTALGDNSDRRNIDTTGSGKGYYFTNGAYEEIIWSKDARNKNTVYKKADGTQLLLNPGKTIINIISPSADITIS